MLTHARCDGPLQEQVLRDIHMLQHQVGAANRADLQRLDALADENAVLGRELAQLATDAAVWITHIKPGELDAVMSEIAALAPRHSVQALAAGQRMALT